MKKKNSGTHCGRVNVLGFKQVERQQYDESNISALVTNGMTIRMALILMLAGCGIAHVVSVKGTFLYCNFDDGEKIYIKVCVCVLSSGYGGSVLITQYQSLDLSAR
jgi:hypothetical protein